MADAETLRKWINSSLREIRSRQFRDVSEVSSVEVKPLTDQLVVIVSEIFRVGLKLRRGQDTVSLSVVYKREPSREGFDKFVKDTGICNVELLIYDKVLRLMEKLILDESSCKELFWPECYLCENNQFLLQDLCADGYKVVPTYDMLDIDHTLLALEAVGKYHAMSLVLVARGDLQVDSLPANILTKNVDFINNLYNGGLNQLADYIEQNWGEQWKEAALRLRKGIENVGAKLKALASYSGKCSVLIHGDFTMRNMLFKFNSESRPTHVKLIDFQGGCWANLAFDLVCLVGTSLLPHIREKHLDQLLKAYFSSLDTWSTRFGYSQDRITYEDVRQAYASFGYLATINTLFAIPIFLGSRDDSVTENLAKVVTSDSAEKNKPFKPSFFAQKPVEEAIKFQLELSLKQKIL